MEIKEMENMRDELMEILEDLRPDVDFENEDALITDGILDSMDVVSLVGEIDSAFDIKVHVENLLPENFDNVDAILALLEKLENRD